MYNVKKLLSDGKNEITISLDSFMLEVKTVIEEKNKKIKELSSKPRVFVIFDINFLKVTKKNNKLLKKIIKQGIKLKSVPKKPVLFYDINFLKDLKNDNRILKKISKNFIKVENNNKKLKKIISDNSEKNVIETKNMSAFKIIALELEEKEKIIESNNLALSEKDKKIASLENENNTLNYNYNELKKEFDILKASNEDLKKLNDIQIQTIYNLEKDSKNRDKNISELKESFIELLNKYNDILVEVY